MTEQMTMPRRNDIRSASGDGKIHDKNRRRLWKPTDHDSDIEAAHIMTRQRLVPASHRCTAGQRPGSAFEHVGDGAESFPRVRSGRWGQLRELAAQQDHPQQVLEEDAFLFDQVAARTNLSKSPPCASRSPTAQTGVTNRPPAWSISLSNSIRIFCASGTGTCAARAAGRTGRPAGTGRPASRGRG